MVGADSWAARDACGVKSTAHPRPLAAPQAILGAQSLALVLLSPKLLEVWSGVWTAALLSRICPSPRAAGPGPGGVGCLAWRRLALCWAPQRGEAGRAIMGHIPGQLLLGALSPSPQDVPEQGSHPSTGGVLEVSPTPCLSLGDVVRVSEGLLL